MGFKDEFGYHEVLDRTHVLVCILGEHISTHPVVADDDELTELVEKIQELMMELYQSVAKKSDEKFK